jgi:predicted nucleotidyltransferase
MKSSKLRTEPRLGGGALAGRAPRDRDFVETPEGFLFCLVGDLHPPDRYTAYLKYTPAAGGRWARGDVVYRRELPYYHVRNVARTIEFLESEHPKYVWVDPIRSLKFSFVPREAVARYYVPETRLTDILRAPADPLEADVRALVDRLARVSGLGASSFGITGSILLGLHNPAFSDIDLLVYGRDGAETLKAVLSRPLTSPLAELEPERRSRWRAEITERFALSPEAVVDLETRRWNYVLFGNRYVSIHPTRRAEEIPEAYGAHWYRPLGPATIEATVTDATDSAFLPAVYGLADVRFEDGRSASSLPLISHEGLFCSLADVGDRIRARGMLEQVDGRGARLVIGTAALADGGALWRIDRARR